MNEDVMSLLDETDRVLLDIKYTDGEKYRKYVGCSIDAPLAFLAYLQKKGIKTTLRTVLIPTLNDTKEHEEFLSSLVKTHTCIDAVQVLPFRKLCSVKYDKMGIPFPFADIPTPTRERMEE